MISIIVPVYNSEKSLSSCINSILAQTIKDWELLLVDDGSYDSSSKICDIYSRQDKRIFVIHQANLGVSMARNIGIKHAKGEWITLIDSDDTVEPGYLDNLLKNATSETNLVICRKGKEAININITPETITFYDILGEAGSLQKLFRKEIIDKNQISYPIGFSTMEDNVFYWTFLLHVKNIVVSPNLDYNYNNVVGSLSTRKHHINDIRVLSEVISDLYTNILKHFSLEKLYKDQIELNLYTACVKRAFISNFKGLSFNSLLTELSEICQNMEGIINSVFNNTNNNQKGIHLLVLFLCKYKQYLVLTFLAFLHYKIKHLWKNFFAL